MRQKGSGSLLRDFGAMLDMERKLRGSDCWSHSPCFGEVTGYESYDKLRP